MKSLSWQRSSSTPIFSLRNAFKVLASDPAIHFPLTKRKRVKTNYLLFGLLTCAEPVFEKGQYPRNFIYTIMASSIKFTEVLADILKSDLKNTTPKY